MNLQVLRTLSVQIIIIYACPGLIKKRKMLGNTRRIERLDPPVSKSRSTDVGGPTKPNPARFPSPAAGLRRPRPALSTAAPGPCAAALDLAPLVTAAARRPHAAGPRPRSAVIAARTRRHCR
jgi:hypothetical protein